MRTMRTMRTLLAVLAVLTVAVVTAAAVSAQSANAGIAGKWSGEDKGGSGVIPVVLQLEVKGSAATGSLTVGQSPSTAISEGKVTGNKVSFKSSTFMNGSEVPVLWEGELKNSKLTLVRLVGASRGKMPALTLERSK